jgi:hypothetical protein
MIEIAIDAYDYQDLDRLGKKKVVDWLDKDPYEWNTGEVDELNHPVIKYEYASDWNEEEIIDYCKSNNYLFSKFGDPIHHLKAS